MSTYIYDIMIYAKYELFKILAFLMFSPCCWCLQAMKDLDRVVHLAKEKDLVSYQETNSEKCHSDVKCHSISMVFNRFSMVFNGSQWFSIVLNVF